MNLMDKMVVVMVAGVLIGVGINQYMYDKDMDGVSNDNDDFPSEIIVTRMMMGMGTMTLMTYFLKILTNILTAIWMESAIMKT